MKNVYFFVLVVGGVFLGINILNTAKDDKKNPSLIVTSSAFDPGAVIPVEFTCEGKNTPPPISWTREPRGTKSFALLVLDPRAANGKELVHLLIYDIPLYHHGFIESEYERLFAHDGHEALWAEQFGKVGLNSWKKKVYGGPCPPKGTHEYIFTVYALDIATLGLKGDVTKELFLKASEGHVLTTGVLIGTYERRLP